MNQLLNNNDTIAAVATPLGEGAIAIIRISGKNAISVADKCFVGKSKLQNASANTTHVGKIVDEHGKEIDQVVCAVYRAPHSYTGEDIVEINCHGGAYVTRSVLNCILQNGARPANPGEFTQRAFLNGKLDLAQAEAVADLINAKSIRSQRSSLQQLSGKLSHQLHHVRNILVDTLGQIELGLDFVEEDIKIVDNEKISEVIKIAIAKIVYLKNSYKAGKIIRDGVRVVIAGRPNVGKSSLLNILLGQERAIVTNIPGTTRDYIEEQIIIDGVLFQIVDTAGLREAEDPVEQEGVRISRKLLRTSDIVLLIVDANDLDPDKELAKLIELLKSESPTSKFIGIENKIDLAEEKSFGKTAKKDVTIIRISALTGEGIEELRKQLIATAFDNSLAGDEESVTITSERHYAALNTAHERLTLALDALNAQQSTELVAVDIRAAINNLGEIIGLVTTEDILNNIFAKFCIGK